MRGDPRVTPEEYDEIQHSAEQAYFKAIGWWDSGKQKDFDEFLKACREFVKAHEAVTEKISKEGKDE